MDISFTSQFNKETSQDFGVSPEIPKTLLRRGDNNDASRARI